MSADADSRDPYAVATPRRLGGAFHAELVDMHFDWRRERFVAHLSVPLRRFEAFRAEVGRPPHPDDLGAPGQEVPVVLLGCYGPTAGVPEDQIVGEAALDALIRLVAAGRLRSTELGDRFQRLDDARARAAGLAVPARGEPPRAGGPA